MLIPFFVSRQIYEGRARCCRRPGVQCSASPSGPSTCGRACRRRRAEPADHQHPASPSRRRSLPAAARDRGRLEHDEYTTFLKVGTTSILLRMLEDPTYVVQDMTLENPIRAIRDIGHDPTMKRLVRLANGREASALDIQSEYLERAQPLYRDPQRLSAGGAGAADVGALPHPPRRRPAVARP